MPSSSRNKFGACGFWYSHEDGICTSVKVNEKQEYFPSKLEFEVYSCLREIPSILVHRQPRIKIKAAGEHFPAQYWRCDFEIVSPSNSHFHWLIEAKGMPTREFKYQMMMLENFDQSLFKQLIIVSSKDLKLSPLEMRPHQLKPFLEAILRSN